MRRPTNPALQIRLFARTIALKHRALGGDAGQLGPSVGRIQVVGRGAFRDFRSGSIYAHGREAFEVHGAIRDKWRSLRATNGPMGFPITDETSTPDGRGRFNHFEKKASIYWYPGIGAHAVYGPIHERWRTLGWETGLGYPTTDVTKAPDGEGEFVHFQKGSIYSHPRTGTHAVVNAIRRRWRELNWERGPLGYPKTSETRTPGGDGYFNHFEHGSIYYTSETSAHEVLDPIRSAWRNLGWERGPLGYPTAGQTPTPGRRGAMSQFQNGRVYWSRATGAHAVLEPVLERWLALDGVGGALGFPTKPQQDLADSDGVMARFERGVIVSSPAGVHAIMGPAEVVWSRIGVGPLGLPTGSAFLALDGVRRIAPFERGEIYSGADGAYAVFGHVWHHWHTTLGGSTSELGYPIADVEQFEDGWFGQFQRGIIRWSEAEGISIDMNAPTLKLPVGVWTPVEVPSLGSVHVRAAGDGYTFWVLPTGFGLALIADDDTPGISIDIRAKDGGEASETPTLPELEVVLRVTARPMLSVANREAVQQVLQEALEVPYVDLRVEGGDAVASARFVQTSGPSDSLILDDVDLRELALQYVLPLETYVSFVRTGLSESAGAIRGHVAVEIGLEEGQHDITIGVSLGLGELAIRTLRLTSVADDPTKIAIHNDGNFAARINARENIGVCLVQRPDANGPATAAWVGHLDGVFPLDLPAGGVEERILLGTRGEAPPGDFDLFEAHIEGVNLPDMPVALWLEGVNRMADEQHVYEPIEIEVLPLAHDDETFHKVHASLEQPGVDTQEARLALGQSAKLYGVRPLLEMLGGESDAPSYTITYDSVYATAPTNGMRQRQRNNPMLLPLTGERLESRYTIVVDDEIWFASLPRSLTVQATERLAAADRTWTLHLTEEPLADDALTVFRVHAGLLRLDDPPPAHVDVLIASDADSSPQPFIRASWSALGPVTNPFSASMTIPPAVVVVEYPSASNTSHAGVQSGFDLLVLPLGEVESGADPA